MWSIGRTGEFSHVPDSITFLKLNDDEEVITAIASEVAIPFKNK